MFRTFGELQQHTIPLSELNKTYGCDICDEGDWLSETEVEIHKRVSHHSFLKAQLTEKNACAMCSKILENEEELLKHIKSVHLYSSAQATRVEREIFICDHCHDIFFNKTMLALHIVHRHHNNVALICPLCPKEIKPRLAHTHLSSSHQFQSVSLCPVCLQKRPNRTELAQHINRHHKYYHCNICGYMSTKERDFHLHLETYKSRTANAQVKKFMHCFIEPRSKRKFSYLRSRAILDGMAIANSVYICVLCRQVCLQGDMQAHVARDHAGVARASVAAYWCACGERFHNHIMLRHHVFKLQGHHAALMRENATPQPAAEITVDVEETSAEPGSGGDEGGQEGGEGEDREVDVEGEEVLQIAEIVDGDMSEATREQSGEDFDSIEDRFIVIVADPDSEPIITVRDSGQGEEYIIGD